MVPKEKVNIAAEKTSKEGLTEQEIVKKITDQYEVEQERVAHDVRQMIQKMYEVGVIEE